MATQVKRRLEEKRCRLPETVIVDGKSDDQILRQSFRSVRKTTTALGQVRFDAAHDDKSGHADFFWSKCLAEAAASQPCEHGLIALWREQAAEIRARIGGNASDPYHALAQAQLQQVRSGVFGAEKWLLRSEPRPPIRAQQTLVVPTSCPQCGCRPLAQYGELVRCNPCGWQKRIGTD